MIGWADVRFAHRFAHGPAPLRLHGAAYARHCWADVVRTSLAATIAAGLTAVLIWWVGDPPRTQELEQNYQWLTFIWGLDLVWAISTLIWERRPTTPGKVPAPTSPALRSVSR